MSAPSKAIDPARVGLSKSLMTSPCERRGWFQESVRTADGKRLRFPMPERVTFGKAVDVAHGYIVWHEARGLEWTVEEATADGIREASVDSDSWALVEDRETFALQVATAMRLFVSMPEGLDYLRPWFGQAALCDHPADDPLHHLGPCIQGNDGESLKAGDIIGTPDYLLPDGSVVDVKTSGKRYSESKFWQSPEMGIYALLATAEAGGELPPKLIYQVYVRTAKPYWMVIETDGTADLVEIGRDTAEHWRAVLAFDSPTMVAANTQFCGDCPWAKPMPEHGFDGCSVGRRMPRLEEAA